MLAMLTIANTYRHLSAGAYMPTYTTASAAARLSSIGISASTVRNYARHQAITPLLSDAAHPEPGKTRIFNDDDLQVIASIYRHVQTGASIEDAAHQVSAGILLEPPASNSQQQPATAPGATVDASATPVEATEAPQQADATSSTGPPGAALVLRSVYERMAEQQHELWERLLTAERENARLQAELEALRSRQRPPWWKRLFHRRPTAPEP